MKFVYILLAFIAGICVWNYVIQIPAPPPVASTQNYGKWQAYASPSDDDGELQPTFMISAVQGYKAGNGAIVTPTLVVFCSHGSSTMMFDFGVQPAKPVGKLSLIFGRALVDGHSYPLNLDTIPDKPSKVMAMSAKDVVRRMSIGEELIVEIEKSLLPADRVTFDIRGFDRAVQPYEARCGIR